MAISPYDRLGVDKLATDAEIKQAYLQRVKENPPDRDQKIFQEIQLAYEAIKDADSRLRHTLFDVPKVEFDDLLQQAFKPTTSVQPLSCDDFNKLLLALPLEKILANASNRIKS